MSRVHVLAEGPTEQAFVRELLAPTLGEVGVFITASVVVEPSAATAVALREAGVIALVVSDAQALDGAVLFDGDFEASARALEACRWGER
jgi:hypothetical protein